MLKKKVFLLKNKEQQEQLKFYSEKGKCYTLILVIEMKDFWFEDTCVLKWD